MGDDSYYGPSAVDQMDARARRFGRAREASAARTRGCLMGFVLLALAVALIVVGTQSFSVDGLAVDLRAYAGILEGGGCCVGVLAVLAAVGIFGRSRD